jgi:hypothetical protein
VIGASPGQQRLLHAIAREAGEAHDHIRDRAATLFSIDSLTELSSDQARQLIDVYSDIVNPPPPPQPTRFDFGRLPKRVAQKPAAAASEPAKAHVPAATRSTGGIGRIPPAVAKPKPFKFDPKHGIDPSLEEIPW